MLQLFYLESLTSPVLTGENAHHADRVLRMKVGEQLLLSDGNGSWAKSEITSITKKEVELNIIESGYEPKSDKEISVLQAITKNDRAKEAVELLTAAGVSNIYPWQATRSIGKESEKWQVTAVEASKQSRRFYIPKVSERVETKEAIALFSQFDQILICHESAEQKISEVVKDSSKTLIVIGPEGGITESELSEFSSAGGKIIKLGRSVLRSAHAGIAAISAVSALMKVW